eukprot:TRINITY_DN470_c0_g1_i1.p1 TRINITY_DN470_c0_g1~~TRINITY_DN470_c0_g1_i1.p1  ORF type:complete len:510 (+),score=135.35 TRINITY_DN470_c0_g1_i1:142-1530(+)
MEVDEGDSSEMDEDPFNMKDYDKEDNNPIFTQSNSFYAKGQKDPNFTSVVETAQDDIADLMIQKSDYLILAGVSEDEEISHLDLYLYDPSNDNLYIHHDFILPSFPLSISWFDFQVGYNVGEQNTPGNYCAVSTFEPYIEVWDLDVIDQPAPLMLLGGPEDPNELGTKIPKNKLVADSHTDSVLSTSWNTLQKDILASGAADNTVKIWSLSSGRCLRTLTHHTNKVQCVAWNPVEPTLLASGGFDRQICVIDVRSTSNILRGTLDSDIESLVWLPAPHHNHIMVSVESGMVYLFDVSKENGLQNPLWRLQAHAKPTQALAVNPMIPGLIATASPEKESPLKIWDISSGKPSLVYGKTADVGLAFSLSFSPDNPFLLVIGIQGERPMIVDIRAFTPIKNRWGHLEGNFAPPSDSVTASPMEPGALSALLSASLPSSTSSGKSSSSSRKSKKKKGGKKKGKRRH